MEFHEKIIQDLNEKYQSHQVTIDKLNAALRREIPLLTQEFQLSFAQVKVLEGFINDRLLLFRYLKRNKYSLPVALSLLLDTIRWRLTEQVDHLGLHHVRGLLTAPLCFFNGYDRVGRPILVIQLKHFPAFNSTEDLMEKTLPVMIFLLETSRKYLTQVTNQRMSQQIPNPVITDALFLVDFKDANNLPKDIGLLQTFIKILKRYPGTTGMVCLLNFGWMYQGMWQMIKLMLTPEAKKRVAFPKRKELLGLIDESQLLTEFGGVMERLWDLDQDPIYEAYGQPLLEKEEEEIQLGSSLSRRSSSGSLYFDSMDTWAPRLPHHQQDTSASVPPLTKLYSQPSTPPLASRQKLLHVSAMDGSLNNNVEAKDATVRRPPLATLSHQPGLINDDSSGVSSWALSQKLIALQQQKQSQRDAMQPAKPENYQKYINKTIESSLSPYVHELPGKTTVEPDEFLMQLLRDTAIEPHSQSIIKPLDLETLKEAYNLKEGPIPGFDSSLLDDSFDSRQYKNAESTYENHSDGERRHKKKEKEKKAPRP
ncbi:CRAL/TRIO domain-containing protein [Hesseltinella vesiculosa]|uniref:CRAL/TRIO domain-containing protein n=1 Tax=Hesseltinella vesiculosa TaxID=101127 RepID=A0A1X2GLJ8_9FUNG|nr:CRAL/TRIO domain-containing protein [Hesseltinella vesiculosa]